MRRIEGGNNSFYKEAKTSNISCYIHRDRHAVGTCVECGKFVCMECNVEINGRNHCQICVQEIMNKKDEKLSRLRDHEIVGRYNRTNDPVVINNYNGYTERPRDRVMIPVKSRGVAAVLAIFFGWIGLHRFYLGRFSAGLLSLLFCWTGIPFLLGLIQGLGYIVMSNERFAMKYGVKYLK